MQDEVKEGEFIPKRGRPSKYESWMPAKLIEVAQEGGHVAAMCKALGIGSKETFYAWVEEHKEFKEAYETAKLESQAFYEEVLVAGACGKIRNFSFPALAMILNNKFPAEYKRSATGSSTEINIGSINSIEKLDTKALDEKIKKLQNKLNLNISEEEIEGE